MIDLDSAEDLGSNTSREPLLIAIVVDHHSGPSLANTRLTGTAEAQTMLFTQFNVDCSCKERNCFETIATTQSMKVTEAPPHNNGGKHQLRRERKRSNALQV